MSVRQDGNHGSTFRESTGWRASLPEKPLGELMSELVGEAGRLFRAEVKLARAELKEEANKAAKGAGLFSAALVFGLLGAMALVACCILAIAGGLPAWAAALIVGVGCLGAGVALAYAGRSAFRAVEPERTIEHIKEDGQWASKTLQSVKQKRHAHA